MIPWNSVPAHASLLVVIEHRVDPAQRLPDILHLPQAANHDLSTGSDQIGHARVPGPEDATAVDFRLVEGVPAPPARQDLQAHGEVEVRLAQDAGHVELGKLCLLLVATPLDQPRDLLRRGLELLRRDLATNRHGAARAHESRAPWVEEPHRDAAMLPRVVLRVPDAKSNPLQVHLALQAEARDGNEGHGHHLWRQRHRRLRQVRLLLLGGPVRQGAGSRPALAPVGQPGRGRATTCTDRAGGRQAAEQRIHVGAGALATGAGIEELAERVDAVVAVHRVLHSARGRDAWARWGVPQSTARR
mmetsp:Transcript_84295/g.272867  ORF Transcript_84295/g.272867 Transcript_84295/m.272867 type:complete len:302 (+) Transcript_84295:26-931(+)